MPLQDKDLGEKKTLKPDFYPSAKLPAQPPLVTDVLVGNGQLQVKPATFDKHEPP
jgi:hypothetical protein